VTSNKQISNNGPEQEILYSKAMDNNSKTSYKNREESDDSDLSTKQSRDVLNRSVSTSRGAIQNKNQVKNDDNNLKKMLSKSIPNPDISQDKNNSYNLYGWSSIWGYIVNNGRIISRNWF